MKAKNIDLPEDIKAWLELYPSADESLQYLQANATNYDLNPEFAADCIQMDFVESILQALKVKGWTKSALAKKMGVDRQRVQRILDRENASKLTIRTMAEIACALGMTVGVRLLAEGEHLQAKKLLEEKANIVPVWDKDRRPKAKERKSQRMIYGRAIAAKA